MAQIMDLNGTRASVRAFICRGSHESKEAGLLDPCRWRQHDSSKCREPLTQRHSVTFLMTLSCSLFSLSDLLVICLGCLTLEGTGTTILEM